MTKTIRLKYQKIQSHLILKYKKGKLMATKQSIIKLTAKHAARTSVNRLITGVLGTGLLSALAKTIASQAIKLTDKYELHRDTDFDTLSIERKSK